MENKLQALQLVFCAVSEVPLSFGGWLPDPPLAP